MTRILHNLTYTTLRGSFLFGSAYGRPAALVARAPLARPRRARGLLAAGTPEWSAAWAWSAPSTRRSARPRPAPDLDPQRRSIASIFAAASRCNAGMTCAYVFSVRLICECPRVSMMVLGSTPWVNSSVAAVCRRS